GPHHRGGADRGAVPRPAAPVYGRPARGDTADDAGGLRRGARGAGRPAKPAAAADRLPVPHPVPDGAADLRRAGPGARRVSGGPRAQRGLPLRLDDPNRERDGSRVTESAPSHERKTAGRRKVARLVDIATAVGVHPSTVSRVLNGHVGHSVRPETVERIIAEARSRGYRPNALARALRQHRTGALTFVVPMVRNPIWIRLQRGALLRAAERGYVVMIMEEPTEDPKPPGAYSYLVAESRTDGLLLATALRNDDRGNDDRGADGAPPDDALSAVPHVYVNRRGPDRGNDVVMDEAAAVRLFLGHVSGLGH